MLDDIIGGLLGEAVTSAVIGAGWEKRADNARRAGKVLAALRVRDGVVGGLSRRWHVVEVAPSSGAVSAGALELGVKHVGTERKPLGYWERVRLQAPPFAVLELHGEGFAVECAIPPEDLGWVTRALVRNGGLAAS